jgi:hypothetical protein
MKTINRNWIQVILIILVFVITIIIGRTCSGQVSFNQKLGFAPIGGLKGFVGAELQGSNVSIIAEWRPVSLDRYVYVNGFVLGATFYLWPYQTSPFFSMKIITHGNYNPDEITGLPIRTMPIILGMRIYPNQYNDNIIDRLSFDIAGGIELTRDARVEPYAEITGNFILFKSKR